MKTRWYAVPAVKGLIFIASECEKVVVCVTSSGRETPLEIVKMLLHNTKYGLNFIKWAAEDLQSERIIEQIWLFKLFELYFDLFQAGNFLCNASVRCTASLSNTVPKGLGRRHDGSMAQHGRKPVPRPSSFLYLTCSSIHQRWAQVWYSTP